MNQVTNLKNALPSICRALTRQKGIRLVFSGPPRTDGRTIYSNPMPLDATKEQVTMIIGDLDHECAHVLYSDFKVRDQFLETVPANRRAFLDNLHNAVEDTFGERRLGEDYLGCRENLAQSAELLIEQHGMADLKPEQVTMPPGLLLAHYVDAWGRVNVLKQRVEPVLRLYETVLEPQIGRDAIDQINAILSARVPGASSTSENCEIALEVAVVIESLIPPDHEPEQNPEPQSSDSSKEEGDGEGTGGGSSKPDNGETDTSGNGRPSKGDSDSKNADSGNSGSSDNTPDNGDTQESNGDSNDGESDGDGSSQESGNGSGDAKPDGDQSNGDSGSQGSGNGSADAKSEDQSSGGNGDSQESNDGGSTKSQSDGEASQGGNGAGGDRSEDQADHAKAASDMLTDNSGVTPLVDRRKAADEACEEATQHSMVVSANTEAQMVIYPNLDTYQALRNHLGSEIVALQRRLVAEYQTLTRRRTKITDHGRINSRRLALGVMGNPDIHTDRVKRPLPFPAVSLVVDCSGSMRGAKIGLAQATIVALAEANAQLNIATEVVAFANRNAVIKPFDLWSNEQKGLIGGLFASGGTATADAMWVAGTRLVQRREARKIMLVVTDGIPNNLHSAIEVGQRITRSGIELYGVGIGPAAEADTGLFCPQTRAVHGPAGIADAVIEVIRSRIMCAA